MKKAISFGVSCRKAIISATSIPAKIVGMEIAGSIGMGYQTDFLVVDNDFELPRCVY